MIAADVVNTGLALIIVMFVIRWTQVLLQGTSYDKAVSYLFH